MWGKKKVWSGFSMNNKLKQSFFLYLFFVCFFAVMIDEKKLTHSCRNIFTESSKLFETSRVFLFAPAAWSVDVQHLGTCSWHQWRHMNDVLLRARALRCHQESRWWTADKMCHRECLRSLWLSFTRASRRICRSFTLNTCSCARRAWDEGERISYGRVTGASCWAAEGKKEVYMVLILFFSCFSVSSNTLYEQQKQSISNTTTAAAVLHQCLPWNLFRFSHSPKVDNPGL